MFHTICYLGSQSRWLLVCGVLTWVSLPKGSALAVEGLHLHNVRSVAPPIYGAYLVHIRPREESQRESKRTVQEAQNSPPRAVSVEVCRRRERPACGLCGDWHSSGLSSAFGVLGLLFPSPRGFYFVVVVLLEASFFLIPVMNEFTFILTVSCLPGRATG